MILDKLKTDFIFYNRVLLLFSFVLGIAYVWGYWTTFDINIFPFLSLFDLLKFSAYPLLLTYVLVLIFQVIIMEIYFVKFFKKNFTTIHFLFFKHVSRTSVLVLICSLVGIWLDLKTLIIGFPAAFYLSIPLLNKEINNEQNGKIFRRYGLILITMFILPFISFDIGRFNGNYILANKEYSFVIIEHSNSKEIYKYLGYINEHYFFIDRGNKKLLVQNRLDSLVLRNYLEKGSKDNPEIGLI